MSTTRLTDLAKAILENTGKLEEYFNANKLPLPSFEEHSPPELPLSPELQQVRAKAVDAATELQDLLIGPAMQLRPVVCVPSLSCPAACKMLRGNHSSMRRAYKPSISIT